jgi:thiol:disulfide interchange protein/DsbC/DsbD-like thiol-disulfide interchange protein
MTATSRISSALLALVLPLCAQFDLPGGAESSVATMLVEKSAVAPGDSFTVALKLEHPDEWHSYYVNSGGVELPPSISWSLPDGFSAGPIQWPVPEVKDGYFGKSFIYSGSPVFLVDIRTPDTLEAGETYTITAAAEWQICKESCINEEAEFTFEITAAAESRNDPRHEAAFAAARAKLPAAAPDGWKTTAHADGGDISLRIEPGDGPADITDFVPNESFVRALSDEGRITRDGDALVIVLKRRTVDFLDNPVPQGDAVSGVLIGPKSISIPETMISAPPAQPLSFSKFLTVLGGMLLGGLILNLMPCVFPVIGLKIMGFVQQAGSDRRKIAFHGVVFTLGVLASFGILSGLLFAARETTGWGFQLQNPWVVFSLMLLMFLLALNMFGVFEMGTSATSVGGSLQSKHGLGGTFFSGVLATIVATPCSGPFLGAAIGAAIALPAGQFFMAFAAMAVGLALPYLVLSIFPQLLDFLPRPGPWMESFKQAMSFLLFATAGYLLWVYAGQISLENLLGPVFGLTLIAVAAWIYGRWNLPHRQSSIRHTAKLLAAISAAAGFMLAMPPKPSALVWETWSRERVEELLAEDTPVFIDFTAQWCATCQVNKKRAYTDEVVALMKKKGIVALRADKTNPNPEIEARLGELGRTAIPVNVLQLPGKDPIITPELLSPTYLIGLFEREIPAEQ